MKILLAIGIAFAMTACANASPYAAGNPPGSPQWGLTKSPISGKCYEVAYYQGVFNLGSEVKCP